MIPFRPVPALAALFIVLGSTALMAQGTSSRIDTRPLSGEINRPPLDASGQPVRSRLRSRASDGTPSSRRVAPRGQGNCATNGQGVSRCTR
jgi:hypothetical protein